MFQQTIFDIQLNITNTDSIQHKYLKIPFDICRIQTQYLTVLKHSEDRKKRMFDSSYKLLYSLSCHVIPACKQGDHSQDNMHCDPLSIRTTMGYVFLFSFSILKDETKMNRSIRYLSSHM